MNIKTFLFIIACALLMSSCKSAKKAVHSDSPYLTEERTMPEITVGAGPEINVLTEVVKPVDAPGRTMYRFYVIIGSFRNISGARQRKTELEKKGFTPVILENENGLFRISVGGFNDERAARTEIAGIRAMFEEHRDVWLLIRK